MRSIAPHAAWRISRPSEQFPPRTLSAHPSDGSVEEDVPFWRAEPTRQSPLPNGAIFGSADDRDAWPTASNLKSVPLAVHDGRAKPKQVLVAHGVHQRADLWRVLLGVDQPARVRHRYDASGRRIDSSGSLAGPGSDERKTMAYNDHGDLIASVSEETRSSGGSIDEQGRVVPSPGEPTTIRSETQVQVPVRRARQLD